MTESSVSPSGDPDNGFLIRDANLSVWLIATFVGDVLVIQRGETRIQVMPGNDLRCRIDRLLEARRRDPDNPDAYLYVSDSDDPPGDDYPVAVAELRESILGWEGWP